MLIRELLKHFFTANSLHGTHSPFIYDFYQKVFDRDVRLPIYIKIEEERTFLKKEKNLIEYIDFGAKGSSTGIRKSVKVSSIAQKSLKKAKWGRAFNRIITELKPKELIELGTSLGITTSYLAAGSDETHITTFEGSTQVIDQAEEVWGRLGLTNINAIVGNIDHTLPAFLKSKENVEVVFIDANHMKEATINYFNLLLPLCTEESILIFDDIYWSEGMKNAWEYIKAHPSTSQTIDLFEIGIVFFRSNQVKEHFKLQY